MNVKEIARDRALSMLKASGAQYVVIDADGVKHTHGDIDIALPKKKSKRRPHFMSKHYKPYVENLKVGESAVIPVAEYSLSELRKAISSWCCHMWGNGSNITHGESTHVEVLRLK